MSDRIIVPSVDELIIDVVNARRPRVPAEDHYRIVELAHALTRRRRHPLSIDDAVTVAIERVATGHRRLSHETGATGWVA